MSQDAKMQCEVCEEIHRQGLQSRPPKLSRAGKMVLGIGATTAAIIYGLTIPFVLPGFRKICLPYVPATDQQIRNILTCLKGRSGSVVDLGSGDGRVLFSIMMNKEVTMNISKAEGVELNSWLVLYSKFITWRSRNLVEMSKISFEKKDIFKTDLSVYDNITVFGVESLMVELEHKLSSEMKSDARVLACRFPLPNWEPIFVEGEGIDKVWVYNKESETPV